MSTRLEQIDFKKLVAELKSSECKEWPTIVGGVWASESEAEQQLEVCREKADLAWRIWEVTDACTIGHKWLNVGIKWLERARIFGQGGDLDVRRDGDRFLWRYVGEAEHAPEHTDKDVLHSPADELSPVYCRKKTALLWGTRMGDQSQWFDDRVSGASLTYDVEDSPERVQVLYREYTQAGRTLAVWLLGLEAYQEVDNG